MGRRNGECGHMNVSGQTAAIEPTAYGTVNVQLCCCNPSVWGNFTAALRRGAYLLRSLGMEGHSTQHGTRLSCNSWIK